MNAHIAITLLATSCLWTSALGQGLRDPTEPPPAKAAAPAGAGAPTSGPVLQSVIVSDGRKLALIDGQTYRSGDKLGDSTIAAISSNEVTLRGPEGKQVLKLYPDLQAKKPGTQAAPASPRAKGGP
jgi:MSHA biogenesis protein MshK